MRVITTTPVNWGGGPLPAGTELDVPDDVAARWQKQGACRPADAQKTIQRSAPRPVKPDGES